MLINAFKIQFLILNRNFGIKLSNSGPDYLQVNFRSLPGPLQLNLYLRFRRSGPE